MAPLEVTSARKSSLQFSLVSSDTFTLQSIIWSTQVEGLNQSDLR